MGDSKNPTINASLATSALRPVALPAGDAPLQTLFDAETVLIAERQRIARCAAPATSADTHVAWPRVGLAISGGGLRSAIFGLGLLRGLARNKLLSRVDYLSTVSGGGFVGAMFGRLVTLLGIERAQTELALGTSPVLQWLRRNGRYLSPSGARDLGIAMVTYLRAIVAIHAEAVLLCLPLVLLVLLPHLLLQGFDDFDPAGWQSWHTLWWPIALCIFALCGPGLMVAYWIARENPESAYRGIRGVWRILMPYLMFTIATVAVSILVWPNPNALAHGDGDALLTFTSLLVLWSCVAGVSYTRWHLYRASEPRQLAVARLREDLTAVLRVVLLVAFAAVCAGAMDALSWWLLEALQSGENWVWGGVGIGGAAVLLLRALAQPLQQLAEKAKAGTGTDWGPRLLNIGGAVGLLVLVLAWFVAAQWLVFAPEPLLAVRDLAPGVRALGLLSLTALWWLLSASNAHTANATSLHSFYRGRLTGAYMAVGNAARDLVGDETAYRHGKKASVREVVPGDDVGLVSYRPEAYGGPLHLVNVCLNQTRDDASGLYNADRKGTLVTASARALEVGPRDVALLDDGDAQDIGTLGRWVATSGVAASPGGGSYASAGWTLLLFFLGMRLGYWLRAALPPDGVITPNVARLWRRAVKPLMLWSEATASFYGRARPWWYLSDGGHFDNTGVYALLKRRLDFIVLSDNSADVDYRFADLENLVRKARIDFGAEIEFYTREEAARHFSSASGTITVLAPEDMADNHSRRGVMMARVRYAPDGGGERAEATLLVIKPNLHDALDLDLLAYARCHDTFPHESTGDQNFDESQWESYQRLGEDIGHALAPEWLEQLPGWSRRCTHPMTVAARLAGDLPQPPAAQREPLWRRSARATAIGATLGLSASGTLLLAAWQASEQFRQESANKQAEVQRLFTDVSRDLRDLDGSCPKVADHTAVQLMMLRNLRASPRLRPLERDGVGQLVEHVRTECEQPPAPSLDCAHAVQRAAAGICAIVNKPISETGALSYWHPIPTRITLWSLMVPEVFHHGVTDASVVARAPPATVPPNVAPGVKRGEAVAPSPRISTRDQRTAEPVRPEAHGEAPPSPPVAPACERSGHPMQLFVQIYDEISRDAANAVVRALRSGSSNALRVAPIENVTRSAALREQRRPVPWPQPTLIVHDPGDRRCAQELATTIRATLPSVSGRDSSVWVRDLPRTLKARPGVIELWIPPRAASSTVMQ